MRLPRFILVIVAYINWANVFASDAKVVMAGTLNLESNNYSQYLAEKSYSKVDMNNNYGQKLQISKVIDYPVSKLYKYYVNKICDGIYIANCIYNKNNIKTNLGIDLSSESSGLIASGIHSVSGYRLDYTTVDVAGKSRIVSGAVLVPETDQPLKGVVLFYHYTILDKNNFPSNFNGDDFQLSHLMASTIAADGYIVLMPDYLGFGADQNNVHPYILYPEENALSGLYMLKPVESMLMQYSFKQKQNKIPLFLSGYSEGGAYSLWAAKIYQDNMGYFEQLGYNLEKTVPILGAYNMSKVTWNYVLKSQSNDHQAPDYIENSWVTDFLKPGLYANAVHSYQHYESGQLDYLSFNNKFASCNGCIYNGKQYSLSDWIEYSPAKDTPKYGYIQNASKAAGYGQDGGNAVGMLTNESFISDKRLSAKLKAADIYNWQATTPVSFLMLEYDSVVPRLNSETAYIGLTRKNSSYVKITKIPNQDFKVRGYLLWSDINVDHPQGVSFMLLFARNEFAESINAYN